MRFRVLDGEGDALEVQAWVAGETCITVREPGGECMTVVLGDDALRAVRDHLSALLRDGG